MDSMVIAEKIFGWKDQNEFAQLSGDRNPMHMDAVFARRTQAGRPVVHGIHCLTWALDQLFAAYPAAEPVARIQCKFSKLVYVDQKVVASIASRVGNTCRLQLKADDAVVLLAVIAFGPLQGAAPPEFHGEPTSTATPISRTFTGATHVKGWLEASVSQELLTMFPAAAAALGAVRVAGLLAMTRWVGMINPGLHSIFSGLDLRCVAEQTSSVHFQVNTSEERYRLLRQGVQGCGFVGTIDSLLRPAPIEQAPMSEVKKVVTAQEFSHLKALVVGASRGLGEITSKLVTAGGGHVVGTYALGHEDAKRVEQEITAAHGSCEFLQLLLPITKDSMPPLPDEINCIFYFATPSVIPQATPELDRALFNSYIDIYGVGFERICSEVASGKGAPVCAFYPSTVYVEDDRPENLVEYAMAKAAGEILCSELPRKLSRLSTISRRIPRVATDLSASVFNSDAGDPLDVMLHIVREVSAKLSQI